MLHWVGAGRFRDSVNPPRDLQHHLGLFMPRLSAQMVKRAKLVSNSPCAYPLFQSLILHEAKLPSRRILENRRSSQEVQNLAQRATGQDRPGFRTIKLDRSETPSGAIDARFLGSNPRNAADGASSTRSSSRGGSFSSRGGGFSSRGGGFGSRGGAAFSPRTESGSGSFQRGRGGPSRGLRGRGRGSSGRGRGDDRSGGPREPRGRDKGFRQGGGNVRDAGEGHEWNAAFETELQNESSLAESYLEAQEEIQPSSKPYDLDQVNVSTFDGNGPSLALGERGMKEVIEEKIEKVTQNGQIDNEIRTQVLAEHFNSGTWVRFRSEEEKEAVLQLVKDMAEKRSRLQSEAKGEIVEPLDTSFQPLTGEQSVDLTKLLLQGAYNERTYAPLKGLIMQVRGGGSITQKQEDTLVKKLRSMLPVQRRPRPAAVAPIAPT